MSLVFGHRRDYSWYGPVTIIGTPAKTARAIAGHNARVVRQRSGARLYLGRDDDAEHVAIVIPARLRPGGHECDVEAWIDNWGGA